MARKSPSSSDRRILKSWSIKATPNSASAPVCTAGPSQTDRLNDHAGTQIITANHDKNRRSLPEGSEERRPTDGGLVGQSQDPDQLRQGDQPHAANWITGNLSKATHIRSRRSIATLSLPGEAKTVYGFDRVRSSDITASRWRKDLSKWCRS